MVTEASTMLFRSNGSRLIGQIKYDPGRRRAFEAMLAEDRYGDLERYCWTAERFFGSVDLRGAKVLPLMLQVVGTPSDPGLASAVNTLQTWVSSGAHRRDLNQNGAYDDALAVQIMDAWWPRAVDSPASRAHLRLPSRITPTWRGTRSVGRDAARRRP